MRKKIERYKNFVYIISIFIVLCCIFLIIHTLSIEYKYKKVIVLYNKTIMNKTTENVDKAYDFISKFYKDKQKYRNIEQYYMYIAFQYYYNKAISEKNYAKRKDLLLKSLEYKKYEPPFAEEYIKALMNHCDMVISLINADNAQNTKKFEEAIKLYKHAYSLDISLIFYSNQNKKLRENGIAGYEHDKKIIQENIKNCEKNLNIKNDLEKAINKVLNEKITYNHKTIKNYVIDVYNEDLNLYKNFERDKNNIERNRQYAKKFLNDSGSFNTFDLTEFLMPVLTKHKLKIDYSLNVYEYMKENFFSKYNVQNADEYMELVNLINEYQNKILDLREKIVKYTKTIEPKIYNYQNGVVLTELYNYKRFGFYIFHSNKQAESMSTLDDLISNLEHGEANQLSVYIFNEKPDLQSIKNAPKSIPANMIFAVEKLRPIIQLTGYKKLLYSVCYYYRDIMNYDYFYKKYNSEWQMEKFDPLNKCHFPLKPDYGF